MNPSRDILVYESKARGVFYYEDIEAVPFNHWKQDCEWLILLIDLSDSVSYFIPITALTAAEACSKAIDQFYQSWEENNDK